MVWSLICPAFWGFSLSSYLLPLSIGRFLAFRVLFLKGISTNKLSWKVLWLWEMVLYSLPLFKNHDALLGVGDSFVNQG